MKEDARIRKMFELLVTEHSPMLVSYLAGMSGSRHEAQDLAQDVFVKAYRQFESFSGDGAGFAAWLRRIGRNLYIDRYRRSRRMEVRDPAILEGMEEIFSAADGYGAGDTWVERVSTLRSCLEQLPERLRVVCRLHYFEELAARAIAARLRIRFAAVRKRLERARRQLRICMERKLGLAERGLEELA